MDATVFKGFLNRRAAFLSLGVVGICLIGLAVVFPGLLAERFSQDGIVENPANLRAINSIAILLGVMGLVAGYNAYSGLRTDIADWQQRFARSAATLAILALIGVQSIAIAFKIKIVLWPFMDYPMFSVTQYEGDPIEVEPRVFAILDDGSEAQMTHEDVGLITWTFAAFIRTALANSGPIVPTDDSGTPDQDARINLDNLVQLYNERHESKLTGIRIESSPWIITRNGGQETTPKVLAEIDLTSEPKVVTR